MPRDIPITRLRNIGIMAHIDAGKTTCAERILFFTGRVRTRGEVHHGNTALDHLKQEQDKGITITAAATTVTWTPRSGAFEGNEHRIQLIDTPGHIDFTIEVERSLRVLDGAIFVLDAGSGVECQSETVWHQANRHGVPRLAFINKTDKVGANVDACIAELAERLGARPVLVELPVDGGRVLLDIVRRVRIVFDDDRSYTVEPLDASERERVEAARLRAIETCAEIDEAILDDYLAGRDVADTALERALRKGTLERSLLVVLCGSALKNRGIHQLLDAVVAYLPSPADLPPVVGSRPDGHEVVSRAHEDAAPLAALAFKTVSDKSAGFITYVRVYSGTLEAGQSVLVTAHGGRAARERVSHVYLLHAGDRERIESACAGAIVAVSGIRSLRTGDTLTSPKDPIVLGRIDAPEPVIEVAIEPRTTTDRDRLGEAIGKMLVEDPSIRVSTHQETGQTILAGMGQLHLEITVDRLLTDHKVAVTMGKPQVAYRETIARSARADVRHVKQSGGSGHFAVVTLALSPNGRGEGITFVDETIGGVIPKEFVPGVEKGVRGAAARGVFAGYPVVDVHVRLIDGDFHAKDSSAAAFEVAGSLAFQQAVRAGGLVLLEPAAIVEVTVPEQLTGDVIGDLSSRRGAVKTIQPKYGGTVITARAPLAAMFDWVSHLRSITSGRGSALVKIDGYDIVPDAVARAILERG